MHNQLQKNHNLLALINNEGKTLLYLKRSVFSGCEESLLYNLFLCTEQIHNVSLATLDDEFATVLKTEDFF